MTSWLTIFKPFRLTLVYMQNPAVSWKLKLIPIITILYVLSPIDLVPDIFLGFGQIDDIALLFLGFNLFVKLAAKTLPIKQSTSKMVKKPLVWEEGEIIE